MTQMELAKVILLTKNEPDLIEDFITYHGALFGLRNVHIVDNGSTDERVLDVYRRLIPQGLAVVHDARPFPNAVHFMSEHMQALRGSCEFILPLETDEFIFCPKLPPGGAAMAEIRDAVLAALRTLPEDVSVLRYGKFWGSAVQPHDGRYKDGGYVRPARQMTRFYDQGWDKIVVRASRFVRMRQWCHHAETIGYGRLATSDDLGLLHFHETGFRRQIERAVSVMRGFGYVDVEAPLAKQLEQSTAVIAAGVSCGHKVEYYDKYLRRQLCVDAFVRNVGRLPWRAELEQYTLKSSSDIELNIRQAAPSLRLREIPPLTRDELVYADAPMEGPFAVTQVADALAELEAEKKGAWPEAVLAGAFPKSSMAEVLARHAAAHNNDGTDKTTSHAYGELYSALFEPLRLTARHVLEIGVYSGASVLAFAEFFENAHVDGVDITLEKLRFGVGHPRIAYHEMDGTSYEAPLKLGARVYDVILDDASHLADHQVRSLDAFARYLAPDGGLYVIEDIDVTRFPDVRARLAAVAERHGLAMEWHDLRHIKGAFDDVVATFRPAERKPPAS